MRAVRRITISVKTQILDLVEVLYDFLPMSSHKDITTYRSIFVESNIDGYLEGNNKREQLITGWENVIRYHERLPKKLIRKIVPAAISYRKSKRNPLKQSEIDALIACLEKLGIDMRDELSKIEIDETVPPVVVPSIELVRRLEEHRLADEISGEPLELFKNGHFNESVRKAAERFETKVQDVSGETETGMRLMAKAFKLDAPIVALNSLSTENEKGIQHGYQLMTMGMMRAIRNIFSHGDEEQRSPEECYEMLQFLNWLFRHLPNQNN